MHYLIGSIFCSSIIFIIFRGFSTYKIDILQAIVVNYIVAGALGFILAGIYGQPFSVAVISNANWFYFSLLIGLMFITIFNLMAISSQKVGVSATSVANKMSVVLTVVFGLIFLNELVTGFKIGGIVLAVFALYFATLKSGVDRKLNNLLFPLIIFFSSGVLDILMGYCSKKFINDNNSVVFVACLFSLAGLFGFLFLISQIIGGKQKLHRKNILAGIILGIPNFGSILFVFEGLKITKWEVSVFYPILNMGIVILTSILGWLIYKEKLSRINFIGILLAVISICLISFF